MNFVKWIGISVKMKKIPTLQFYLLLYIHGCFSFVRHKIINYRVAKKWKKNRTFAILSFIVKLCSTKNPLLTGGKVVANFHETNCIWKCKCFEEMEWNSFMFRQVKFVTFIQMEKVESKTFSKNIHKIFCAAVFIWTFFYYFFFSCIFMEIFWFYAKSKKFSHWCWCGSQNICGMKQ